MLLNEIVETKKGELIALKEQFSKFIKIENLADIFPPLIDFKAAINKSEKISLIAEIKQASPSAGIIVKDFDPIKIAETYEKAGASAISVLTDAKYFQGMLTYLKNIKEIATAPVLRKDFIIDDVQILESRMAGSDAILLISRILEADQLKAFYEKCIGYNMAAIVECHDEKDLEKALAANAEIIGINNRDLDTLKVDFNTSLKLAAKYPELKNKVLVSESGIDSKSQINELHSAGFKAVLIGESILKSGDISSKIKDLGF